MHNCATATLVLSEVCVVVHTKVRSFASSLSVTLVTNLRDEDTGVLVCYYLSNISCAFLSRGLHSGGEQLNVDFIGF